MTVPRRRLAPVYRVQVTQKHINESIARNSRTCAIANALAALGALRPIVHRGKISFTINGERFSYFAPTPAHAFIAQFDRDRKAVAPFTLTLREGFVKKAVRLGGRDRTEHARHAAGGRAAREGFQGTRISLTKERLNGFPVPKGAGT